MLTLQSTSKQHLELTTETAIQEIKDGSPFWAHSEVLLYTTRTRWVFYSPGGLG